MDQTTLPPDPSPTPASHMSSLAIDRFPSDLTCVILDQVGQYSNPATLLALMRCSKAMYDTFSKPLYRRIEVNGLNKNRIFAGIDWDYAIACIKDGLQEHPDEERSPTISWEGIDDARLAAHERKLALLKNVEYLVITDRLAARTMVRASGYNELLAAQLSDSDEEDEDRKQKQLDSEATAENDEIEELDTHTSNDISDHGKSPVASSASGGVFSRVRHLSLGRRFLMSEQVYPYCAHDGDIPAYPVITALTRFCHPPIISV
ncbi:hypothetical protein IAT40_004289 [Kwoniella sp. CBS 6097]